MRRLVTQSAASATASQGIGHGVVIRCAECACLYCRGRYAHCAVSPWGHRRRFNRGRPHSLHLCGAVGGQCLGVRATFRNTLRRRIQGMHSNHQWRHHEYHRLRHQRAHHIRHGARIPSDPEHCLAGHLFSTGLNGKIRWNRRHRRHLPKGACWQAHPVRGREVPCALVLATVSGRRSLSLGLVE